MAMLDIQRRHATVFRIRLGHTVETGDGKERPEKLTDRIRITAPGRRVVEAFAEVYGGEVQPWGNQYEVYLPTNQLNVLILPGQSCDQWWEFYKGSVCQRRCDGVTEQKSGKPCVCPADIDERASSRTACSPTTRLNVLCPDVKVLGSGSLVTHSLIAAETLPQAISVAEGALRRGVMVPAVLKVVEHRSRNHFIYPQLIIHGYSLDELQAGGDVARALPHAADPEAITAGEAHARTEASSLLTPVPESVPEGPVPSVAEQAAEVEQEKPRSARKNAAEPVPATGVQPRPAAQVIDVPADAVDYIAVAAEHGLGKVKALKSARAVAETAGVRPPTKADEVNAWVAEHNLSAELLQAFEVAS